ncbi:MAG: hypothetical protein ACE5JN_13260 [Candidatus Methylomirabilia bacterium]
MGASVATLAVFINNPDPSRAEIMIAIGLGGAGGAIAAGTIAATQSVLVSGIVGATVAVLTGLAIQAATNRFVRKIGAFDRIDDTSLVISGIAGGVGGLVTGFAFQGEASPIGALVAGTAVAAGLELGLRINAAEAVELSSEINAARAAEIGPPSQRLSGRK